MTCHHHMPCGKTEHVSFFCPPLTDAIIYCILVKVLFFFFSFLYFYFLASKIFLYWSILYLSLQADFDM